MEKILIDRNQLIAKIDKATLELAEKLQKAIEETQKKVSEIGAKK